MGAQHFAGVFDGAKILLGSSHNLAHKSQQAVAIGAVGAMKYLDEIQVLELLPVKHDVVAPAHLGDAVNREAGGLVEAHTDIQNDHWHDHAVNDGPGDEVLRPVSDQPAKKALFESPVGVADGFFELDPLALDLVQGAVFLLQHDVAQIVFKFGDLVE